MNLNELKNEINKIYYLKDDRLLEVLLAVHISRMQKITKLWLMVVGNSGDGKTELLKLFDDNKNTTYQIKRVTGNTFINSRGNKKKFPDMVTKMTNKVIHIPEMAQIFNMNNDEKKKITAQLTDMYDGEMDSISGDGTEVSYRELNISLIGCSTPNAFDKQMNFRNELGTRELTYRIRESTNDETKIVEDLTDKNKSDYDNYLFIKKNVIKEIKNLICSREYKDFKLSDDIKKRISEYAELSSILRASATAEKTGDLIDFVYPESRGRIFKQYLVLFNALKSIDDGYTDDRAIDVIRKITLSNANQIRIKTLMSMIAKRKFDFENTIQRQEIADELKVSKQVVYKELNVLHSLGLISKESKGQNEKNMYHFFWVNTRDRLVNFIAEELSLSLAEREENEVLNMA